jgi:hypothetical protein
MVVVLLSAGATKSAARAGCTLSALIMDASAAAGRRAPSSWAMALLCAQRAVGGRA